MWNLDVLGESSRQTASLAVADSDARVKLTAIRICEPLLADDLELIQTVSEAGYHGDMTVVVQVINSLHFSRTKETQVAISAEQRSPILVPA